MRTFVPENTFDPSKYHPEGVLHQVKNACSKLDFGSVLAIDGWPSSGKSPTAIWFGRRLGWQVIHLDDFNLNQRHGCNFESPATGFDEDAMRSEVNNAISQNSVIVEGVCAARICTPDILLHLGFWPGSRLLDSTMEFIGDYRPEDYFGKMSTFCARFSDINMGQNLRKML